MSDSAPPPDGPPGSSLAPPPRMIRHIQPMGLRVLVRLVPEEDRSPAGLYLPQGVAEKHQEAHYAEVVEVARAHGRDEDEADLGANISGVPDGAYVLFPREAGTAVPWDAALRLVDTKEILAVVTEVPYEATH